MAKSLEEKYREALKTGNIVLAEQLQQKLMVQNGVFDTPAPKSAQKASAAAAGHSSHDDAEAEDVMLARAIAESLKSAQAAPKVQALQDDDLLNLRSAVLESDLDKIEYFIKSPANSKGEFYKHIFKTNGNRFSESLKSADDQLDPEGNNLLLLSIATAAFSKAQVLSEVVTNRLLEDAKQKLSVSDFKAFLDYTSAYDPYPSYKCFQSSPVTLSFSCGLYNVAKELLKYGANINSTDFRGNNLLHLAAYKMPFVSADAVQDIAEIVRGAKTLKNTEALNERGLTPKDVLNLPHKILHDEALKFVAYRDPIKKAVMTKAGITEAHIAFLSENHSRQEIEKEVKEIDFDTLRYLKFKPDDLDRDKDVLYCSNFDSLYPGNNLWVRIAGYDAESLQDRTTEQIEFWYRSHPEMIALVGDHEGHHGGTAASDDF